MFVILAILVFLFSIESLLILAILAVARLIPSRRSILRDGYLTGGVRSGPVELQAAGYKLGGIPNRAFSAVGLGAKSYAARWLSSPQDSPPIGRRLDRYDRLGSDRSLYCRNDVMGGR